ncbi:hypothetical protein PAAG_06502 [Paracoccidioides lutzii Pb01]|uniref:Uncharacterized protein n=1 Tax=Paracoccidioides lutzii (strain ATCC MYA-826 / Pb01) TaxID=502779 RepID=C1H6W1_PARBA|nr:hypothetical protein PAAG_06502 [Paracoccidioides lutzii Pb01]EEH35455.2 hypothetical protein PAAG_06502 [Paracoccidioides lutzii Pb01]
MNDVKEGLKDQNCRRPSGVDASKSQVVQQQKKISGNGSSHGKNTVGFSQRKKGNGPVDVCGLDLVREGWTRGGSVESKTPKPDLCHGGAAIVSLQEPVEGSDSPDSAACRHQLTRRNTICEMRLARAGNWSTLPLARQIPRFAERDAENDMIWLVQNVAPSFSLRLEHSQMNVRKIWHCWLVVGWLTLVPRPLEATSQGVLIFKGALRTHVDRLAGDETETQQQYHHIDR